MLVHGEVNFAKVEQKRSGDPYLSVTFIPDKHLIKFNNKTTKKVKYYVTFWDNVEQHKKVLRKGNKGNLTYKKTDINVIEKNGELNVYFNLEGLYFQVTSFAKTNNEEKTIEEEKTTTLETKNNKEKITNNKEKVKQNSILKDNQKVENFLKNLDELGI